MSNVANMSPDRLGWPLSDPLRRDASPWQGQSWAQLLAAFGALVPMVALVVWTYVLQESPPTIAGLLLWPLLGGGCLILWVLFLHVLLSGDSLDALGFRKDRVWLDVLLGAAGSLLLLTVKLAFEATLARLMPSRPPAPEIVELLAGLSRHPLLLTLWLGPVVWIGVAGFEELWRAFMLRRLWRVWRGQIGRWVALLVVSTLVGLAHFYQGWSAVVAIALMSILMGWFFMATGRVRALIVAHALYDSVQIVFAVIVIRRAMG